jgi:hypothetical protein
MLAVVDEFGAAREVVITKDFFSYSKNKEFAA